MAQTVNDLFEAKLRKRLAERIVELQEQSSVGIITDLNRQNFNNGQVAALQGVFDLCDQVQEEINKR